MTQNLKVFLQCLYAGEYLLKSVENESSYNEIDKAIASVINKLKSEEYSKYLDLKDGCYIPKADLDDELEEIIDEYDSNRLMDELIETISANLSNADSTDDPDQRDSYREYVFNELEENGLNNIGIIR